MPRYHFGVGAAVVGILVLLLAFPTSSNAQTVAGEWRAYAGDVRATKYSPLDQINRNNVSGLRIAWRQSAVPPAVRGNVPSNYEHTPLMAGGLLYMSTAVGRVAAVDPATGRVVWVDARGRRAGTGARSRPQPSVTVRRFRDGAIR